MIADIIKEKCKKIKLLAMDVDGTMTDGKVYYSGRGEELKRFSIRDGLGIVLLKLAGMDLAIITAEKSNIVRARASKLNIKQLVMGSKNKDASLKRLSSELKMNLDEIAFIGDDINDIGALRIAGLSICPSDAVDEVKKVSDYVCSNSGGNGAIRETAEMILVSQNKSINLPENWE